MDGPTQSKVWEVRSSDFHHRGRLGLIATGKNDLGLHVMLGEVCVEGTHQIKTVAELNGHRVKLDLPEWTSCHTQPPGRGIVRSAVSTRTLF